MFGLTPFERKSYDLFNAFHDFENDFFGENARNIEHFKILILADNQIAKDYLHNSNIIYSF